MIYFFILCVQAYLSTKGFVYRSLLSAGAHRPFSTTFSTEYDILLVQNFNG